MAAGIQFQKKPALTRDLTPGVYPGDPGSRTGMQTRPAQMTTFDDDFSEKLKEQLAEAGKDYDAADQPFKSLSPVSIPGARHQPVANPSMLTTRGIPTGGSYNPYLGDPAKRKPRPR